MDSIDDVSKGLTAPERGMDHFFNNEILILLFFCPQKSVQSTPPPTSHWKNPGSALHCHVFFSFKVWPKHTVVLRLHVSFRTTSPCETMILASSALWLVLRIVFEQLEYPDQTNDFLWKFKANYWNCNAITTNSWSKMHD